MVGIGRVGEREVRLQQSLKYTKCPVSVVLNENDDGFWEITKTVLDHYGHSVSKKEHYMDDDTN